MSIAAASFHSNAWDNPVRRTGLSLLMSGDVPHHLFHQHQQQQQLQEGDISRAHQRRAAEHELQALEVPSNLSRSVSPLCSAPSARAPVSSDPVTWFQGGFQSRSEQDDAQEHKESLRRGSLFPGDQSIQHGDGSFLQKFSALSVQFNQVQPTHAGAGLTASSGSMDNLQHSSPAPAGAVPDGGQSIRCHGDLGMSGGANPPLSKGKESANTPLPSIRTPVFSSLDAVDGNSPPFSPAEQSVPTFFFGEGAASFSQPLRPRAASLCCCCGAGVCASCKGVPFACAPPLRASASHPLAESAHGRIESLGLNSSHREKVMSQHLSFLPQRPSLPQHQSLASGANPWFSSLPSQQVPGSSPAAAAATAAAAAGTMSSMMFQGGSVLDPRSPPRWPVPHSQSLKLSRELHPMQGISQLHYSGPRSLPSPSAVVAGSPDATATSSGGHIHGFPGRMSGGSPHENPLQGDASLSQWGFAMQSMESSSLSLSQDCSDSLGGTEVSSAMQGAVGADAASADQEVDSLPLDAGRAAAAASPSDSQGRASPCVPSGSRGTPPLPPLGSSLSAPSMPRSSSSPVPPRPPLRDGGSPTIGLRRGLSSFFGGKSRSFTSLAEVASIQSIQELAKPVRNYARRKRIGSGGKDGNSPRGSAGKCRLGVDKESGSPFKKGNGTRQSLGIQAGLAVALAMGSLDVPCAGEANEPEVVPSGMETVMEEITEGQHADSADR